MNCYNHNEISAVAQCQDCRKGLCKDCAKQYSITICTTCNSARSGNEKSLIMKELFWTFGLGFALTFIAYLGPIKLMFHGGNAVMASFMMLMMFYLYSGLVAGWYNLNRITPQVFLFLPLFGWVIYFALKMVISIWVGLVVLPIRTMRNIKRLK